MNNRLMKKASIALAAVCLPVMVGCTSMITPEQLSQMRDLRGQERNLTEQIRAKHDEKSKITQELNARMSELKKCTDDKTFIQQKLSQWPNCWPDYTPAPPAPAAEGESK